jgi:hypothetical protein
MRLPPPPALAGPRAAASARTAPAPPIQAARRRRSPAPTPPAATPLSPLRPSSRRRPAPAPLRALANNNNNDDDETRAQPLQGAVVSVDQFPRLRWRRATVIANEAVNLSGDYRLLRLSVPDDSVRLFGRKIEDVPFGERWVHAHTSPGQLVGLRLAGKGEEEEEEESEERGGKSPEEEALAEAGPPGPRLYPLACSPYESRRDSASIGASLIEVAVARRQERQQGRQGRQQSPPPPSSPAAAGQAARAAHEAQLAELGPGDEVEVSGVVGRGFASMFSSYAGLLTALEERRPLLLVAHGLRGAALMRAALSWTPVQAHATAAGVAAYYVDDSPSRAAFVAEWDAWREAGVRFTPLFLKAPGGGGDGGGGDGGGGDGGGGGGEDGADDQQQHQAAAAIADLIEQALFVRAGGLEGALGGAPQEATALLAGLPGKVASAVSRELSFKGVPRERLLFVDFL